MPKIFANCGGFLFGDFLPPPRRPLTPCCPLYIFNNKQDVLVIATAAVLSIRVLFQAHANKATKFFLFFLFPGTPAPSPIRRILLRGSVVAVLLAEKRSLYCWQLGVEGHGQGIRVSDGDIDKKSDPSLGQHNTLYATPLP